LAGVLLAGSRGHSRAATLLREAGVGPGELVLVVDGNPAVLDAYDGLPAVAAPTPPPGFAVGFSRVWVVASPAESATLATSVGRTWLTAGAPLLGAGGLQVTPWTPSGGRTVAFDLLESVRRARVAVTTGPEGRRPCRWNKGRHRCPDLAHVWVGERTVRVGGQSANCLWAHPYRDGVLEVIWSNVPTGGELAGRFAFTDGAARATHMPPLRFEVSVGSALHAFVAARTVGFQSFTVPIGKGGPAGTTTLRIRISGEDTGAAHFCFDGTVVR